MTTLDAAPTPALATGAPPFSRALRLVAGLSLVAAGLLNGLPQAVVAAITGDLSFDQQIAWGADHPLIHGLEQAALVVSSLVMPLGLLGIAHVSRFRAPVLTAIATPLVIVTLLAEGLSNAEIGRALFISPITVRNHVSSIFAKLQVTNRRQAMLRARGAWENPSR